ncbi:hypothetical protein BC628DRAFT_1418528 [Trametes gibbosa]|nr:hypothetical protein BC628DRAFT_1418528 [Trametes gibbosa]
MSSDLLRVNNIAPPSTADAKGKKRRSDSESAPDGAGPSKKRKNEGAVAVKSEPAKDEADDASNDIVFLDLIMIQRRLAEAKAARWPKTIA